MELCRRLGITDQLINTNPVEKGERPEGGQLHELPEGLVTFTPTQLGPFFRSGSCRGSIWPNGLRRADSPRRSTEDESLRVLFRRRFGRHACERVMEPLMAGIYAGDAEQMSLRATFPRFYGGTVAWRRDSRDDGGRRARARPFRRSPAAYDVRHAEKRLADLVAGLTVRIPGRRRAQNQGQAERSGSVSHQAGRWMYDVICSDGTALSAEALVLATPAYVSADLVRPLTPLAAGLMERFPMPSTATFP